jgi:hypothetical protein
LGFSLKGQEIAALEDGKTTQGKHANWVNPVLVARLRRFVRDRHVCTLQSVN